MMLSLVYEGQFFSFAPLIYYKEAGISVIRPLVYIDEAEIRGFRQYVVSPDLCKNMDLA